MAAESVLRQCINPTDEIVQPPVLACRCISPEEKKFHDFHFKCDHNADEKGNEFSDNSDFIALSYFTNSIINSPINLVIRKIDK